MAVDVVAGDGLLRAALDALGSPFAVLDAHGCIEFANAAWLDEDHGAPLFGPRFAVGSSYLDVCRSAAAEAGDSAELVASGIETLLHRPREPFVVEYAHGEEPDRHWYEARLSRFGAGKAPRIIVTHTDVTGLKTAEQAMEHRALYDALTGLPNRVLFFDRLTSAITTARREGKLVAAMIMDLDRFKEVNDTLGHHAGDIVLEGVAKRLGRAVRESDTVARMGGDEFGIVQTGVTNLSQITTVVNKVLQSLAEPFTIEEHKPEVGGSIGIAIFPDHGQDPETLMGRADVAMYKAKRESLGHSIYGVEGEDAANLDRGTLTSALREAMERDQLVLLYQPIVNTEDRGLAAVEALLEWNAPGHELLRAEQFFPLAERIGLIKPLTHWMLNAALRQSRAWWEADKPITIAVPVPTRVLQDSQLPQAVARLLRAYAQAPQCLQLHLTEASLMAEHAFETANRLGDLGVGLCVTEFQSGYSGLPLLERLAIREIKLPPSMVHHASIDEEDDAGLIRSTIELAHQRGLRVIAPDIDNDQTETALRSMGCDALIGSQVAAPMTPDQLDRWLRSEDIGDDVELGLPVALAPWAPRDRNIEEIDPDARPAADLLSQISLFSLLDRRDLDELANVTRRRTCEAGDVIFRKEDPGYTLYLIVSGAVKISDPSPKGGEVILAILRSGQFFGELSLFDDEPRSADATAVEQTELLALSREDLLKVLERRPSVTVHLFKVLSERLRATNETLKEITSLSLPGRIAKRLLDLAQLLGERQAGGLLIPLVLGPEEISNMIGAPAAEVERVLQTFHFSGLVSDEMEGLLLTNEHDLQSISLG
ncbi:MAG: diguanylate cyclase [Chloroflexi bacterium]|nr:diguanylate cyclase [Chloroflexota bacterium]